MTTTPQDPEQERRERQERAQRAAAVNDPQLEAPTDAEELAQRAATAHRVDGAQA